MRPDRDPALRVEHLRVAFRGTVALDDLGLDVPAGATLGVIGPNGAGKTTLLNACSGLVPLDRGRVVLGGRDVTRTGAAGRARRGLGRTFQTPRLFAGLTVAENVELVPRAPGGPDVAECLELAGLADRAGLTGDRLTAAQRRVAELARCLPLLPRLILLDEPGTGLRESEVPGFVAVLDAVRARFDLSFCLVDHNMSLVAGACGTVAVLDAGRLIALGGPDEVRRDPAVRRAYFGTALDPKGDAVR